MLVGNPADWVVRASDPRIVTGNKASAYVKIAEGCNRSCSFCVIPQLRGKQRSRPVADVVREVQQLVAQGVREVNLISQDTIAYGRDHTKEERATLAELVRKVADVKGLSWVRVFYLYPEKIDDELIDLLANHPRVVPYVDMPLQHASDAMLKRMQRGHGVDRQKRVVERMRASIPDLTFRTAFIVGHPGETDADFEELCDFVKWARFERVGVFRYSDEETAKSSEQDGKVPKLVAVEPLAQADDAPAQDRAREEQGARRPRARGPRRGRERGARVRDDGPPRGQAPDIDGQVYLSGGDGPRRDAPRPRHAGERLQSRRRASSKRRRSCAPPHRLAEATRRPQGALRGHVTLDTRLSGR